MRVRVRVGTPRHFHHHYYDLDAHDHHKRATKAYASASCCCVGDPCLAAQSSPTMPQHLRPNDSGLITAMTQPSSQVLAEVISWPSWD